jgi:hypothetical protein
MTSIAQQIYHNANVANLKELVEKWQQWHVDNLEPIVNYPTGSEFALRLYENRPVEKKLVAWFLANVRIRGQSLISNTDKVVVPEGSSSFYIGLGIAAWRSSVCVISTNGPLFCEYLCNPAFSNALDNFYLVGGKADHRPARHIQARPAFNACQNGGLFNATAREAYEQAITDRPEATVVIMPVSGILPNEGPYGLDAHTRELKRFVINCSVRHGVRKLVFVADYTKHCVNERNQNKYGLPVLNAPSDWNTLLEEHHDRIALVTAPPPAMRDLFRGAPPIHPAERLNIQLLRANAQPSAALCNYNQVAREFGEIFQDSSGMPCFHEAWDNTDECKDREELVSYAPSPRPHYVMTRSRVPVIL